jgi:hypothetical protein
MYDYRLKYPRDKRYHELDKDARVFWVYNDEAASFDSDMVGKLSDSLDFAGLRELYLSYIWGSYSQSPRLVFFLLSSPLLLCKHLKHCLLTIRRSLPPTYLRSLFYCVHRLMALLFQVLLSPWTLCLSLPEAISGSMDSG